MAIVRSSPKCKGYCVDRDDMIAAERRAEGDGLSFEYVAENHGERAWVVYPTEADVEIIEMLEVASRRSHYEHIEAVARRADEERAPEPERKSFPERHPNLPLVIAICALICATIVPLLR